MSYIPIRALAPVVAHLAPVTPLPLPLPPADRAAVLGELAPYARAGTSDLLVNGAAGLWIDDGEGLRHETDWRADERQVRALAVELIAAGGRHVDEATPCADVRLGDGIRVHVVLPPISGTGTLISVRLPAERRPTLGELETNGGITAPLGHMLREAVAGHRNLLISGPTGSGKTTLLAALLALAPESERIVTVEDVAELRIAHPHVVALEARQANLEGVGGVGLERLVREALRMRPDRLVVGEVRGAEVRELFSALNTGHAGGAGTVHANSLVDVPARIEALGALAGLDPLVIARQAASAIDMVAHLERKGGRRRVAALGVFALDATGRLRIDELRADDERGDPDRAA